MTHLLLFVVFTIYIPITALGLTHFDENNCLEYQSCKGQTLDCTNTTEKCIVTCGGPVTGGNEACMNAIINCGNVDECIVNCNKHRGCANATIYAHNARSLTVITANDNEGLKNATIYCNSTSICDITCTVGDSQCKWLTIYAEDADTLIFRCQGPPSYEQCRYMSIYCPTDSQDEAYTCQISFKGIIQSDIYSETGFNGFLIDTAQYSTTSIGTMHCCPEYFQSCNISVSSFEIGCSESSVCDGNLMVCPTTAPSDGPTTIPSNIPSNMPTTLLPTTLPSKSPTIIPTVDLTTNVPTTTFPTIYPTNIPTNNPTNKPSVQPTAIPTLFPSVLPTETPSNIHTTLTTTNPTVVPNIYPTYKTLFPSVSPTETPSNIPSNMPTTLLPTTLTPTNPTIHPTNVPTSTPTVYTTNIPSIELTIPTLFPSVLRTDSPSNPTVHQTSIPTNEITNVTTTTSPGIYTTNQTNSAMTQTETNSVDLGAQATEKDKQIDTLLHIIVPIAVLLLLTIVIGIIVFFIKKQKLKKEPTVSGPSELNMVPVMVPDINKIRRGSTIEFYQNNDNENDGSIGLQQEGVSSITKIPQQEQIPSTPQYSTPGGPQSEPNELINDKEPDPDHGENSEFENDIPNYNNEQDDNAITKGQDSDSDIYESDD